MSYGVKSVQIHKRLRLDKRASLIFQPDTMPVNSRAFFEAVLHIDPNALATAHSQFRPRH